MNRYTLFEAMASGGMGTVHYGRATNGAGLARVVAIKRMHGELARDPVCRAMFQDELRLATRVRHPNVVATLDVLEQDHELLMVMEHVQGESLQELIARAGYSRRPTPPAIAVSILCGVLQGLEAAHEAKSESGEPLGIVHRDVSPENVLVGKDGIARLLDFGIARGAGRKHVTRIGEIKGKPSYLSPEQVLGQPVDRRADVYGASVVLWEALTGRRLFDADTLAGTLGLVLHETVVPPSRWVPSLPQGLDEVVMRGLNRDPRQRFATALEMARALRCVCGTLLPFEIAEWVESVAGDALARQAEHISRLECAELKAAPSLSLQPSALEAKPEPVARAPRYDFQRKLMATGFAAACFLTGLVVVGATTLHSRALAQDAAAALAEAAENEPVASPAPVPIPLPPQALAISSLPEAEQSSDSATTPTKAKKKARGAGPVRVVRSAHIVDDGF